MGGDTFPAYTSLYEIPVFFVNGESVASDINDLIISCQNMLECKGGMIFTVC